jgi:hypothetical protein
MEKGHFLCSLCYLLFKTRVVWLRPQAALFNRDKWGSYLVGDTIAGLSVATVARRW